MDKLTALQEIVDHSRALVFLGGAGVSAASGIPVFRDGEGTQDRSAEELLSEWCFALSPERFFRCYREKLLHPRARPNVIHAWLAELERRGRLRGLITQNVDGLHRQAGSVRLFELHGSVWDNACDSCGQPYTLAWMLSAPAVPRCECGGIVRPGVVLYGGALNPWVLRGARRVIAEADTLLVAGTSLQVEPAASLPEGFQGRHLIVINRTPTPLDAEAGLVIRGDAEAVFAALRQPPPIPQSWSIRKGEAR